MGEQEQLFGLWELMLVGLVFALMAGVLTA